MLFPRARNMGGKMCSESYYILACEEEITILGKKKRSFTVNLELEPITFDDVLRLCI